MSATYANAPLKPIKERLAELDRELEACGKYGTSTRTTSSSSPGTTCTPTTLLALPGEILARIFFHLDLPPPSVTTFGRQPELKTTSAKPRVNNDTNRLKTVSLLSRDIRRHVLPVLFRHSTCDVADLDAFLAFLLANRLTTDVCSVHAYVLAPQSHQYPTWWSILLDQLSELSTLTVTAVPHIFSELAAIPVDNTHAWAFDMPCHTIQLSLDGDARQAVSRNSQLAAQPRRKSILRRESVSLDKSLKSQLVKPEGHTLLTVLPWTSFGTNESSFVPSYTTYEYFLKRAPSLFHSVAELVESTSLTEQGSPSVSTSLVNAPILATPSTGGFLNNLLYFNYTAIFPFYNHVDEVLKCVRQMKNLEQFEVKLCPDPELQLLEQEVHRSSGRVDVRDFWNEFDTAYTLISHTVIYLSTDPASRSATATQSTAATHVPLKPSRGTLRVFKTNDVQISGICYTLVQDLSRRLQEWWTYDRGGTFLRK